MDEESPKPLSINKFLGKGEESPIESAASQNVVRTPILSGGFDLSSLLGIINTQIETKSEVEDIKDDSERLRLKLLVDSLTGRVEELTSELAGLFSLIIGDIKDRDSQKRAELKLAIQEQSEITKAVQLQALQKGTGDIVETSRQIQSDVQGEMESTRQMGLLSAALGLGAATTFAMTDKDDKSGSGWNYGGGNLSMSDLVDLAEKAGFQGNNIPIAAAIAQAESRGDPAIDTVKSGTDPEMKDEYSIGLWQINWKAHKGGAALTQLGVTDPEQLRDPWTNAQAAYLISGGSNFQPWTAYESGSYKTYLDAAKKEYQGSTNNQQASISPAAQTQSIASAQLNEPTITGDPSSVAKISTSGPMVSVAQVKLDTEKLMQEPDKPSINTIVMPGSTAKRNDAPASSIADGANNTSNPIFSAKDPRNPYPDANRVALNIA
jgi:hypothetical protein